MDRKDYLIDTASERSYQNQSDGYKSSFTAWRNDPKNRFGYRFVHDSREHTYVDGEGFADEQCRAAELKSLHSCLQFLGTIMLIYFGLEQIALLIAKLLYGKAHINWVTFSQRYEHPIITAEEIYLYCTLRLFIVVIALAFGRIVLKLPLKVMLPHERQRVGRSVYLASVILVFTVLLRGADIGVSAVVQKCGLDSIYYVYVHAPDRMSQACYYTLETVVVPVLIEILFRGMILQLFRQFGDRFAIFITALAHACCYHEVSKMLFIFIMSCALGVAVLKTGSIYPAIFMRVISLNLVLLLNSLYRDIYSYADLLTEIIISISILVLASAMMFTLRVYFNTTDKLEHDSTELDFGTKVRQLVNAPAAVIWLICMMLAVILAVKFI